MLSITNILQIHLMIVAGFSFQSRRSTNYFSSTSKISNNSVSSNNIKQNVFLSNHRYSSNLFLARSNKNKHFRMFAFPKKYHRYLTSLSSTSENNEISTNNNDLNKEFPTINGDTNIHSIKLDVNQTSKLTEQQQEAQASSSILSTGANKIKVVTHLDDDMQNFADVSYPFVKMFRGSASYIANHRNTVIVYHLPGEFIESEGFPELIDDIALTWILGMKIVSFVYCFCIFEVYVLIFYFR